MQKSVLPRTISYTMAVNEIYVKVEENKIDQLKKEINNIILEEKNLKLQKLHLNAVVFDDKIEYLCTPLQVVTACFSSFARGK